MLFATMMGCAASASTPVSLETTTAPTSEEVLVADEQVPVPYTSDDSCSSFHDNELVGVPYKMGFHYCLFAEGSDSIVGCEYDADSSLSVCYNRDDNPEVGVRWNGEDGNIYIPQSVEPVASIVGEMKPMAGGQVMVYTITFGDGTHSSCTIGGPTVQYCRVDW